MDDRPIFEPHIDQLKRLLDGPDPIVVVPEPDDDYLLAVLERIEGLELIDALDSAHQWERIKADGKRHTRSEQAIEHFLEETWNDALAARTSGLRIVWLRDLSDALHTPRGLGHLKGIASKIGRARRSDVRVLLSGHEATAPAGASHLVRIAALERPSDEQAREFVRAVLTHHRQVGLDEEKLRTLLDRLRGLEASAIRRIIARATAEPDADLLGRVKEERDRMLETGVIEVREIRKDAVP